MIILKSPARWTAAVLLTLVLAHVYSCMEELDYLDSMDKVTVTPNVPLPLINDKINLANFLRDNIESRFTPEDSIGGRKGPIIGLEEIDGISTLFYEDTASSITGEELVDIYDRDTLLIVPAPPSDGALPSGTQISIPDQVADFEIITDQPDEIDSMTVKAGTLTIGIRSSIPAITSVKLTFSSTTMADGKPLEKTISLDGAGASSSPIDLKDTHMDLTKTGSFNTITYTVSGSIVGKGRPITNTSIACKLEFSDVKFRTIYGKIAARTTKPIAESLRVGSLEATGIDDEYIHFKSPSVTFDTYNSFGIPVSFTLQKIEMVGVVDDKLIKLSGPAIDPPNNVYELKYPSRVEEYDSTKIRIDETNSNLADAFSAFPYKTDYRLENSLGGGDGKGFVSDTSRVKFRVRIRVPLYFRLKTLTLVQDYKPEDDWGFAKKGTLKIETTNGSPMDALLQIYFKDDEENTVDSLFLTHRNIAPAVPVDENDFSNGVEKLISETFLSAEKMKRITDAPTISFRLRISSFDNGSRYVKISPKNSFEVKVTASAHIEYTVELDE